MKYFKHIIIFLNIFIISCGIPDVTGITLDLNQPYIVEVIPGDGKVTIKFEAQNNEPAFSGYNVYFGDSFNPRKYMVYNQQLNLPTINALKSEVVNNFNFAIESGVYYSSNKTDIVTLNTGDIPNGTPIYVWISSYQISPMQESTYSYDNYVKSATPRPERLDVTVSSGTIEMDGVSIADIVSKSGNLYFENVTGGGMQVISGSALDNIVVAPKGGYMTNSFKIVEGRLYLIRVGSAAKFHYAKIFVKSVSPAQAVIDYCVQLSPNILSY